MLTLPAALSALMLMPAAPVPKGTEPTETGFGIEAGSSDYLPVLLLKKKPVQQELGLTEDQLGKINALGDTLKTRVKDYRNRKPDERKTYFAEVAKEVDAAVPTILDGKQYPRFRQLVWQAVEASWGAVAFANNPWVAKALGLTDEQKTAVAKLDEEARAEQKKRPWRQGTPDPAFDKRATERGVAVVRLLSAEQKERWNRLQGEPFKGEFVLQPGMRPFKAPEPKK